MLNLDGRSSTIPQLDSEIERRRWRAVKKREEKRQGCDRTSNVDGTKRDDSTKDDGNDDGEESRRVAARLAADRDERIEKFRREAGSQDTARRIDWVTEIIRTMSDARFVKRFFSAGRRSVSCFRERSDKGTKVPTEGRYDR